MPPRRLSGLSEMAAVAGEEARRIRKTQAILVKEGMRKEPHPEMIWKAEVFEDIERMMFAIQPVRQRFNEIVGPVLRAMATAEKFPKSEPEPEQAPDPDNEKNSDDD